MIGNDPEGAWDVIGNLVVFKAIFVKKFGKKIESFFVNEVLSKFIGLQQVHKAESVSMNWNLLFFAVLLF